MVRKKILFLLVLCSFLFISCSTDTLKKDEELVQMVKEKEINDYLFSTYQITFKEYEENILKLFYKDYNLDYIKNSDKPVFNYEGKKIFLKDVINYTPEELKELRENFLKAVNEQKVGILPTEFLRNETPLEISKVYYDEDLKHKVIFLKHSIKYEDPKEEVKFYRRYIFRQEGDKWNIWEVRQNFLFGKMPVTKEIELFSNYHGEEVEYPYTVDLKEYDKGF